MTKTNSATLLGLALVLSTPSLAREIQPEATANPPVPADALPPIEELVLVESAGPTPGHALGLKQVIAGLEGSHPLVAAAEAKIASAEAKQLAADGGFDLKLSASGKWIPVGKEVYNLAETLLSQPTPYWGATFFGGWRRGGGDHPSYAPPRETVNSGEAMAGVTLPLLQGRPVDGARAKVRQAALDRQVAGLDRNKIRLKLALGASDAYWSWVAAGHRLRIREHLLEVANERMTQITDRVKRGDLPEIEAVDNQRTILKRRESTVKARRDVEKAAIKLSLYLRDEHGDPRIAPVDDVPPGFPGPHPFPAIRPDADVQYALSHRPEVRTVEQLVRRAHVDLELADNQIAPQLDLTVMGVQPLEDEGKSELEAGLKFSLPLQRRKARGAYDTAAAMKMRLSQEARFLSDQIAAEVADARSALTAAAQRVTVAREAVQISQKVEEAEKTRLSLGASTVLVVNLREQATADAADRLVDALAENHIAYARWLVMTGRALLLENW